MKSTLVFIDLNTKIINDFNFTIILLINKNVRKRHIISMTKSFINYWKHIIFMYKTVSIISEQQYMYLIKRLKYYDDYVNDLYF